MIKLKQLRVNKLVQSRGIQIDNLTDSKELITLAVLTSSILRTPFLVQIEGKSYTIDSRKILESPLVDYIDSYSEFNNLIKNYVKEGINVKLGNAKLIDILRSKIKDNHLKEQCNKFYNTYKNPYYKGMVYI